MSIARPCVCFAVARYKPWRFYLSQRPFIRRKMVLSSSGSWHDRQPPCQESGRRTHRWVDSCPHRDSWLVDLSYGYVQLPWSTWWDGLTFSLHTTAVRRVTIQKNWVPAFFWWRPLREVETSRCFYYFGCVIWIYVVIGQRDLVFCYVTTVHH